MADSTPHSLVVEVNEANFAAEVEQSPLPVFVDFWAPWCGPCVALAPLFEQLAEAYRGQIKFVKINSDDNAELMQRFGIRGLPTLLLLRNGQVVETQVGWRSKSGFANLLDPHVQRPLAAEAAPQRAFRAFHGDTPLRESVAARIRDHVQSGRIVRAGQSAPVSDAEQQRYSLMGGALNDADVAAFESTLGIPGPVGRLQESVHGLLLQQAEGNDAQAVRLQSPHDAWPLDWWLAIPPGADLQSLPSRFIAWLLSDRSAEIYPYFLSEEARGVMIALASLNLRFARGDTPADEEWRAARSAAGALVKRGNSLPQETDERTPQAVLMIIEMLAWPSHELNDALPQAISHLQGEASSAALRNAYTIKEWAEREAPQKAWCDEMDRMREKYTDKREDLSPEATKALEEDEKVLEELRLRMLAERESRKPFEDSVTGKANLAYAERLHAGLMLALEATVSGARTMDLPEIPYERFELDNGLTVIVHEDHKAPVVAVSIWYHVGSANEPAGKTGFAHLFEHLMFSGSEHHRTEYFQPFELAGATDQNGTTWFDRTNYFQTVPTTALDMTLWMESDRMGHLLGAIGQHELDTQRGVVTNEKRQNENQPYGRAMEELQRHAFPANHPYRHTTIGSMQDIAAASLDDVRQWFRTYYGAANVVLVLAGDITPAQAREKAIAYFGDIPAGPPVARPMPWVAPRTESTRSVQHDQVPMVLIMREWNVPQLGHADLPLLQLAAHILGGGTTSRLFQRLMHREQLAAGVSVGVQELALASMFVLNVNVRPGVDPATVEAAVAEEWQAFLRDGPDEDELARASTSLCASFVGGLEKVGGFGGKAPVLAQGQLYRDDPAAYRRDLAQWQAATPDAVVEAARRWIAQGDHTLTIVPASAEAIAAEETPAGLPASPEKPALRMSPERTYRTTISTIDRSRGVPSVKRFPDLSFPPVQRARLSNGIGVTVAERHTIPVTHVLVNFDAGLAAEQGANSGTARLALAMLNEGTRHLDSVEIGQRQQRLGATIQSFCGLDGAGVGLSALNSGLPQAVDLLAEIVRFPAYRETDLERLRALTFAAIQGELSDPAKLAARLLPRLLYGEGHAYGTPSSGTGSPKALQSLLPAHLGEFHRTWLRPELATVFVAGDTTLEAVLPLLEAAFGDWAGTEAMSGKQLAGVVAPASSRVHLVHRPGTQAQILAGRVVAPGIAPEYHAMQLANAIFGGVFTSRLNMNLREDKRWTYGAGSGLADAIGPRTLGISTSVQVDKTAESMREIVSELQGYASTRPPTAQELDKVKAQSVRTLPGTYETAGAVLQTLLSNQQYGRPDDYAQTLKRRIEGTDLMQVAAAAREMFAPEGMTWVVVGDLTQIEKPVREFGIGDVVVVDAAGIE